MAFASIPVIKSLVEIHPDQKTLLREGARWNHLAEEFEKRFGRKPSHICRAPGRVNLIGEHIDYSLFGVFPSAVERDILIACAPREPPEDNPWDSAIVAENLDDRYEPQRFTATRTTNVETDAYEWYLGIDKTKLRWESYVKAGYFGVLNKFLDVARPMPQPFDMLITGTVPAGSGLSSSAAMVVASTLAFLTMNKKLDLVNKGDLVKMTMENEKRVGVNSGGMDQASSILSLSNHALYISFYPSLSPQTIPVLQTTPPTTFIIANSLKTADKVVSSKIHYNLRVVETLVAARVLAKGLGVKGVLEKQKITLREVLGLWIDEGVEGASEDKLEKALKDIDEEVEKILGSGNGKQGLTMDEMIEASGLEKTVFNEVYLSWVEVEATHFQLYKRAKHVFSEALRVLQFRQLSLSPPSDGNPLHEELGRLMNESQDSCRDLFECSSPELDELVKLCRESGAWGSRLTGAGWGGCTVSLVSESDASSFIKKLKDGYKPYQELTEKEFEDVVFATKPGSGAAVYALDASGKAS